MYENKTSIKAIGQRGGECGVPSAEGGWRLHGSVVGGGVVASTRTTTETRLWTLEESSLKQGRLPTTPKAVRFCHKAEKRCFKTESCSQHARAPFGQQTVQKPSWLIQRDLRAFFAVKTASFGSHERFLDFQVTKVLEGNEKKRRDEKMTSGTLHSSNERMKRSTLPFQLFRSFLISSAMDKIQNHMRSAIFTQCEK